MKATSLKIISDKKDFDGIVNPYYIPETTTNSMLERGNVFALKIEDDDSYLTLLSLKDGGHTMSIQSKYDERNVNFDKQKSQVKLLLSVSNAIKGKDIENSNVKEIVDSIKSSDEISKSGLDLSTLPVVVMDDSPIILNDYEIARSFTLDDAKNALTSFADRNFEKTIEENQAMKIDNSFEQDYEQGVDICMQ